jgi:hypothetical protein
MKSSIFKNEKIKPIDHNKKSTYIKTINTNVEDILNKIFNDKTPFNIKVHIKTINNSLDTYLVSRDNNTITTLHDEVIPIEEIIELNIIKKDFF